MGEPKCRSRENGRSQSKHSTPKDALFLGRCVCHTFSPNCTIRPPYTAPRGLNRQNATDDSTQRRLSRFLALRGPAGVGMRGATPPVESECVFVTVRAGVSCGVGCFGAPLWGRWLHGEVSGSVVRPRKWCAHARDAW